MNLQKLKKIYNDFSNQKIINEKLNNVCYVTFKSSFTYNYCIYENANTFSYREYTLYSNWYYVICQIDGKYYLYDTKNIKILINYKILSKIKIYVKKS